MDAYSIFTKTPSTEMATEGPVKIVKLIDVKVKQHQQ